MRDGIHELARDMSERQLTLEDFEGPRFVRLMRVQDLIKSGHLDDDLRLRQ